MQRGLVGHPLGHSYSKGIHEEINHKEYQLFDLDSEAFDKFFENKKIESAADEVALLVEFANSQGYDVTADDVQAFAEKQYKALSEEELEKINAAGAGGFCIIVGAGWGWSESVSIFKCNCYVIGAGIGPGWKEVDAEAAKRESEEFSKKKARGCAKIY